MKRLVAVAIFYIIPGTCHAGFLHSFQHGDGGSFSNTEATYVGFRQQDTGFPNQPTFVNDNFSNDTALKVQHLPVTNRDLSKGVFRTLIRFTDFIGASNGQVANGAQITSATLSLTLFDNRSRVSQSFGTFDAFRMTKDWDEDTVTWNMLDVSPDDYDPAVLDTVSTTGQPLVWDITQAVQAWVNGTPNYGVGIVMDLSDPEKDDQARFYSEDVGTVSWRPKLTVEFEASPVPEPASLTLFGFGTLGMAFMAYRRQRRRNRS